MYWSKDLKDISSEFKTDFERGLSEAAFEEARKKIWFECSH